MAAPIGAPCVVPRSRCPPAQFPPCAVPRSASYGSTTRGLCVVSEVAMPTSPVSALRRAHVRLAWQPQ
eukprot:13789655-Alexandrium_andersonii.AAC.1